MVTNKADQYRYKILESKLYGSNGYSNNRINLDLVNNYYSEVLTIDEIYSVTNGFKTHKTTNEFLNEFVHNRLDGILSEFNFTINNEELDLTSTNNYDGYELRVPIINEATHPIVRLFDELDEELNPELRNKASDVPITKEPYDNKTPNLPGTAKVQKTQNPKRVDLVVKAVFNSKFKDYKLKTDVGDWKAIKGLNQNGKLLIVWESQDEPSINIECLIFPEDSNKILIKVKNIKGDVYLDTFFEIYRIPTHEVIAEKFFRKTLFSLLKKYIDTSVIQIDAFNTRFVFWKTDNPNFSYSFSTPNKNKIILDLISFISTARKPILDDFFEANNLKHKQGYLQTLLDSAEAAGIFKFKREGNEILILRGPNYKAFLEGKVRRVT